jgi:MFS family permease
MKIGLDLPPQIRVYGAFMIYAFTLGQIFPRLGDLQHRLGVETGALGLALIGAPIGTLVSLTLASPLLARIGFRPSLLALIPLLMVFYAIAVNATSPAMLFLLLLPVGLCIGCIELIVNLEADRTEHLVGRRIMNRAHSFWSLGFFSAGLVGAALAQLGLSAQLHLAVMVPVIALATALVLGRFTPAPNRAGTSTDAPPLFARPTLAIMVLVCVTLSAMIMEGAGSDWSAIYMREVFAASPFLSGLAVATGALTQGVTRFLADRFVERFSPTGVARVLLSVLGLGALIVFFAPSQYLALVGFALMGVGTSAIFPLAMSAAAQRLDRPSAINVAALAQTSFLAFLLGPPLLGGIAQQFGMRWIFGIGLPLVLLSFFTAHALGTRPATEKVEPA